MLSWHGGWRAYCTYAIFSKRQIAFSLSPQHENSTHSALTIFRFQRYALHHAFSSRNNISSLKATSSRHAETSLALNEPH